MLPKNVLIMVLIMKCLVNVTQCKTNKKLLVIAVTTDYTDGYLLYLRSLRKYGLKQKKMLALGRNYTSHSLKITLLNQELEKYKDRNDVVVLFTDSYDVLFTAGEKEILQAFEAFNANIVFSAETNCWPNPNLASYYPKVPIGYRYLNSGGFIGYAPDIYDMLPYTLSDDFDDQLYYTSSFLNKPMRDYLRIKLDTQASIFLSLHDAEEHISFDYGDDDTRIFNHYTNTTPKIIHGNGNGKILLHIYSSLLAKSWSKSKGCLSCNEGRRNMTTMPEDKYPKVLMGVFIERPTPFLKEKLDKIHSLAYPKKRIFLFVYSKIFLHESIVRDWMKDVSDEYLETNYIVSSMKNITDRDVRDIAMKTCKKVTCDVYFSVDSEVVIENPDTLKMLVSYRKSTMAPLMLEPGTSRSTFWGFMTDDETFKYIESFNYQTIVNNEKRGIWNVPQVFHIYVMESYMLNNPMYESALYSLHIHPDIAISHVTKQANKVSMFLYVSNLDYYGHLSNMDSVTQDNLHNDLWQVASNSILWEKRYLHPQFHIQTEESLINNTTCQDVYKFPLFTAEFCKEMIETMEINKKQWSDGQYMNQRLYGGFQNLSSINIQMNQIGFEDEWNFIVRKYLEPIAEKVFKWSPIKSESISGFIVRYDADDHHELNSYEDGSTYTISVALNRKDVDFQGGGSRLLRYNCTVEEVPIGWALIHPGKHTHEGIPITNGTKYTLVSFIDS